MAHDRPTHRDALPLAPGERGRLAVQQLVEAEDPGRLLHASVDLVLRHLLELETERHVVEHAHVRVERVVLEHHRDVALLRWHVVDDTVTDADRALGHRFEPGDHPERGGLATARRPDQDHELLVVDLEVERLHCDGAVRIHLPDIVENDLGQHIPHLTMSVGPTGHPSIGGETSALLPRRRRPSPNRHLRHVTARGSS